MWKVCLCVSYLQPPSSAASSDVEKLRAMKLPGGSVCFYVLALNVHTDCMLYFLAFNVHTDCILHALALKNSAFLASCIESYPSYLCCLPGT